MAPRDTEIARPIKLILSDVRRRTHRRSDHDRQCRCREQSFHVRDVTRDQNLAQGRIPIRIADGSQFTNRQIARCRLGITLVRQGFAEKLPAAREMIQQAGLEMSEVCYIGDDLPDLSVMYEVGLSATVADAGP